jgi:hypothetical protein
MRYYLHVLRERERLRDYDGEEFSSLASAREEAIQSARDLIAEELRCGRVAPSQWRIQVALEDETIVETVPFAPLLLGGPRLQPWETSVSQKPSRALCASRRDLRSCAQYDSGNQTPLKGA